MKLDITQRVRLLAGEHVEQIVVEDKFREATRLVYAELPNELLEPMQTTLTDSGSGVDVSEYRIIEVHKAGYTAVRYNDTVSERIDDATYNEKRPIYWVSGTTLTILPGGGSVVAVQYPTVNSETIRDSSLAGVPSHILDVLVYRTALLVLEHLMLHKHVDMKLTVTLPTAPTAPTAPSFTYSNASAVAPSSTSIGALPAAPTYSSPSFTPTTPPTVGTLDLTTEVDGVTPLTPPTAPSAPNITYTDAVASSVTATTIGALGTAPAYTKPTATASLSFTDWTSYLNEEDPEMMAENIRKLNTELEEIQTTIQDERNEFDKELAQYRQDAEHKIQQAQITLQEEIKNADMATRVSLENERATFEALVADWRADLELYTAQIQEYRVSVDAVIQQFSVQLDPEIQVYSISRQTEADVFRTEVQDARNALEAEITDYQAEVQRIIRQAEITAQEAAQTAQQETEVNIRNAAETIRAAIEQYASSLNRFSGEIEVYRQNVASLLEQLVSESQVMGNKLRSMEFDRQRLERKYEKSLMAARLYYRSFKPNQGVFHHEF